MRRKAPGIQKEMVDPLTILMECLAKNTSEFRTLNDTFGKLFKGSCIKSCATHQDEAIISSK